MIAEGLLLPITILAEGTEFHVPDQELWLVRKGENKHVHMTAHHKSECENWESHEDCLLLIDGVSVKVNTGMLVYRKLRVDILGKLLAFVDEANTENTESTGGNFFDHICCDSSTFSDKSRTEAWFLAAYVMKDPVFKSLINLLRRTECYGLVRYLLSQSVQPLSLYQLGKAYGVSYSHFRRLCSSALGGRVKSEMCSWRMARAVLEIIENKIDMTSAAYKYGYSSSSHFSAEVKSKLGKTPRELCKKT